MTTTAMARHAGPELDKAVAASVGWQHVLQPVGRHKNRRVWFRDGVKRQVAWRYSTNPVHIPEMLAWLNERGWCPEFVQYWPNWSWHVDAWQRFEGGKHMDRIADCETLQHALANLVVAVAKRPPDVAKPVAEEGA